MEPHESIKNLLQDVSHPTLPQHPQSNIPPVIDGLEDEVQQTNNTMASTGENKGAADLPAKPVVSDKLLNSGAKVTIATFDFTQDNLFTWFGKVKRKKKMRRLYGDDWETKLNDAESKIEMANASHQGANAETLEVVTKEDISILRNEKKFDEYFEGLGLTPDEKEALMEPVKELMKENGGAIPPGYLLMLTLLQIFGARGMELYDA